MLNNNENKLSITTLNNGNKSGIKFCVKVIPGSSRSEISGILDGELKIKLHSPPVDGKANKECVKFLSKQLKCPKTSIQIISGETNKHKTLFISGEPEVLEAKLKSLC